MRNQPLAASFLSAFNSTSAQRRRRRHPRAVHTAVVAAAAPVCEMLERRVLLSGGPINPNGTSGGIGATPRPITATEGGTFSGPVATFVDSDSNATFSTSIKWGDGTTTAGSITSQNGVNTLSGSHSYADDGPVTLSVAISETNDNHFSTTTGETVTVGEGSTILSPGSTITATEGESLSAVVATFSDPGTNDATSAFDATIDWGDGTSSSGFISGSSGNFTVSGSHIYGDELSGGLYTVTVTEPEANFTLGAVANTVTVNEGDTLTPPTTVSASGTENSPLSIDVPFTDTYTTNTPSDFTATIDWGDGTTSAGTVSGGSGTLSVDASHTYADETFSNYAAVVTLSDNSPGTASATASVQVTVDDADSLTGTGLTVSATELGTFSGAVATFSDPGYPGNIAGDFSANIDWGDGTTVSVGTVSGGSGSDFTVSGSHTYAEDGSYPVTTNLSDDINFFLPISAAVAPQQTSIFNAGASASGTANVAEGDFTVTAVHAPTCVEGLSISGTIGTFSDPGSTDPSTDYNATIDWGDGTTTTGTVAGSAGSYVVGDTHTFVDEGTYTIAITVAEPEGNFTSSPATSTVTVTEADTLSPSSAPQTVALNEGDTAVLATFTDIGYAGNNPADFTATIDLGNGTSVAGTVTGGMGSFTVSADASVGDIEEGLYNITVTLADDAPGTATATLSETLNVTDAPLTPHNATLAGTEGALFSNATVATFTDADPNGMLGDYTATIDWNDGSPTTVGTVKANGMGFKVVGSHTYADEGTYHPVVTIHDAGTMTFVTDTITVADKPVVASGGKILHSVEGAGTGTVVVATFTDPGDHDSAGAYSATINWNDGSGTSPGSITYSGGVFTVKGSHTYVEEGTRHPTVVVHNGTAPASNVATDTAIISDALLTASGTTLSGIEGRLFNPSATVATFTDANAGGTASDFSALIDWGDGHTLAGVVVKDSAGHFHVTGNNAYGEQSFNAGYVVKVKIQDTGGSNISASGLAKIVDAPLDQGAGVNLSKSLNVPFSNLTVGTFRDQDSLNIRAGDYTGTIDWGDGTTSTAKFAANGAPISNNGSFWKVQGSHTYKSKHNFKVTITLHDSAASSLVITSHINVT